MIKILLIFGLASIANAQNRILDSRCTGSTNPNSPIHLPHESDCSKFYKCEGPYAVEFPCPPGLHWRVEMNWCDWPEVANCNTQDNRCPPENTDPPVHLPHEDCSKFYKCDWGVPKEFDCPPGQHWNAAADYCDWPENAGCEAGGPQCPKENTDPPTFFPHENDCTRYYMCSWGIANERTCPSGQHWRVDKDWCDWPEFAQCDLGGGNGSKETTSGGNGSKETTSGGNGSKETTKDNGSKETTKCGSKEKNSKEQC